MPTKGRLGRLLPLLLPLLALVIVGGRRFGLLRFNTAPQPVVLRPDPAEADSSELVFVFIGSSRCAVSRSTQLRDAVTRARDALRLQATREGARLKSVGVAVDVDPLVGLKFLQLFGDWDEVTAGGAWLNEAVVRYVWRDLPGPTAVPQILLVRRRVRALGEQWQVSDDQLVMRKVGLGEIQSWLQSGADVRDGRRRTRGKPI